MACQSTSAARPWLSVATSFAFTFVYAAAIVELLSFACRGLLGTVRTVAQEEGPKALWNGLEAGAAACWPCREHHCRSRPCCGPVEASAESRAI